MSGSDWLMLAGVFLGGALPWLEAIIVIPVGIVAGLPVVLVVLAGVIGNLLTVALAAWSGEWLRGWWAKRRQARRTAAGEDSEPIDAKRASRRARAERIMARWGMPALAILGPLGLGTQVSALVAVGVGARAAAAFAWVGGGTVLWSVVVAVAAVAGLNVAGIGA